VVDPPPPTGTYPLVDAPVQLQAGESPRILLNLVQILVYLIWPYSVY
jgi:hypothetical protein